MRITCRWAARYVVVRCLAFIALILSLPASAHLLFTYTSDELPITAFAMDGELQDIELYRDLSPISFSFSFTAPEQDLSLQPSTVFRFKEFSFSVAYADGSEVLHFPLDLLSSRSGGWVTLNSAGEVTGWNVLLRITELVTPETDLFLYRLARHFVALKTSSETGEDKFSNRFHPLLEHGDHWHQLVKLQLSYSGANAADNWTLARIAVPEPGVAGLLLAGLLGLCWSRRERRR